MPRNYLDRSLAAPLLLLNFTFYVIVLGIAGWSLDIMIGQVVIGQVAVRTPDLYGNAATPMFVIFTLIACVVGIGSILISSHLANGWGAEHASTVISIATLAWSLLVLAFGVACKEISIGHTNATLKFMEIFVITLAVTHSLYLIVVWKGHERV
ncbi:hypothetical protein KP509_27G060800 [Ceratopteris richardii]|uniref:Uncharacterized protein n=1 Tax=Ceratopteris richardii TaxID=49495 RepID=A0A8T2RIZ2_CERRI|nr:hypothetical protein KP509_27G060800 [Ceratopteris richardii]KAH7295688.1 hypothetical protein KP509_27G060800 [Ceratopteris richardii]